MHIYICIYTYMHVHSRDPAGILQNLLAIQCAMFIYLHTHTCVHVYIYMYIYIYIYLHICICMYVHAHVTACKIARNNCILIH